MTTAGGPAESHRHGGCNRFTMADLVRPLDDTSLAAHGARYRALLTEGGLRASA